MSSRGRSIGLALASFVLGALTMLLAFVLMAWSYGR